MKIDYNQLSKVVSHALRHEPWLYELELDDQGWVDVDHLIEALRKQKIEWQNVGKSEIIRMIDTSSKKRHELHESRIRALYGHSIPGKLEKKKANPPVLLFHGTDPSILERILKEGLLPMGRQYVHLSVNIEIAREVGKRKTKKPVVLSIAAEKAYNDGIAFYIGNDKVWLADQIPCSYITVSFNNNCDSTSAVARHVRRGKSVISNGLKSHSGKD